MMLTRFFCQSAKDNISSNLMLHLFGVTSLAGVIYLFFRQGIASTSSLDKSLIDEATANESSTLDLAAQLSSHDNTNQATIDEQNFHQESIYTYLTFYGTNTTVQKPLEPLPKDFDNLNVFEILYGFRPSH